MEDSTVKRIMPHSTDAEQSVIGAMLIDNESIPFVDGVITGEDFYHKQYGIMFEAAMELNKEGKPVDLLTLRARLEEKDVPSEISNMTYIGEMIANVPVSNNAKHYAEIIKEKATLRQLIRASEGIVNSCYAGKDKTENIMDDAEKNIFEILTKRRNTEFVPISEIVNNNLKKIQEVSKLKTSITGIPTGFKYLDEMLSGLHPSELILIAARPSMGKTAFALNIAEHIVLKENQPVAIFSLEMSKEDLANRLLAMESRIDLSRLRTGELRDDEWQGLFESVNQLGRSGLIIDDTAGLTIGELRSKAREYKLKYNIQAIFVDYLQLMSASSRPSENRQQEVSEISRSLKAIAREIEVPLIALSQLSRAPELRGGDHRPMMSDLRESGSIEQDADVVMLLYREDYYNKDTENKNQAEIIVGKQRNGRTGKVDLAWLPDYTKFVDLERERSNG